MLVLKPRIPIDFAIMHLEHSAMLSHLSLRESSSLSLCVCKPQKTRLEVMHTRKDLERGNTELTLNSADLQLVKTLLGGSHIERAPRLVENCSQAPSIFVEKDAADESLVWQQVGSKVHVGYVTNRLESTGNFTAGWQKGLRASAVG